MTDLCDTPQPTEQSALNRLGKDKFILVLNLPEILRKRSSTDKSIDLNSLQISIFGAVVPAIQVPSVEVRFAGQSHNVSSFNRPNYPPLTTKFVIDNNFKNYWVLWKWLQVLNDPKKSVYTGTDSKFETYKDRIDSGLAEYQTNLSVLGLNEYNEQTIEFTYYNAFITNLGGIDYNYRDPEVIESTAEFQYSQFDVKLLT